ncbi:MAG: tetraacyldisaccharide 4'-kinase [Sedimenticola sp.]|nr:tetraacyldisaccharide 4'-kinase [Sedimenticola sp.]
MKSFDHYWYSDNRLSLVLLPLALLFRVLAWLRRRAYRAGILRSHRLPVPVIVVGNITVGGTGKSPLVIWLANWLSEQGYRPGIVSRGYGGRSTEWPLPVDAESDPGQVGDEPVMIARRTGCPVWVGPDRPASAVALLAENQCDMVISDDGLQHYALARDIEIAVIDGKRGVGNGHALPAGPLREPLSRLRQVDLVIANGVSELAGWGMKLKVGDLVNLADPARRISLHELRGERVYGVAAIGNPERFFSTLRAAGLSVSERPFADHYPFRAEDLETGDGEAVIMTEKDAVKCARFARPNHWYLEVSAQPDNGFVQQLERKLGELRNGQETA